MMNETSGSGPSHLIRTPWGDLAPRVDLFPLIYLILLYGVVYFLPFGLFDLWRKGEDGIAECLAAIGIFIHCVSLYLKPSQPVSSSPE